VNKIALPPISGGWPPNKNGKNKFIADIPHIHVEKSGILGGASFFGKVLSVFS
jgi:hypothetical protein